MNIHRKIFWRNILISSVPGITRISEFRRLMHAAKTWRRDGWIAPPPYFVRRAMLLTEAREIGAALFVESGTFLGDTTWGLMKEFRQIHTIEVEPSLAALAKKRFANHPSVNVIEGDSSIHLPGLCKNISEPCLFYLDGHYSGGITGMGNKESPIIEELHAILNNTIPTFRIVIDDARLFGLDPSYPDLSTLENILAAHGSQMRIRVENDAILIS